MPIRLHETTAPERQKRLHDDLPGLLDIPYDVTHAGLLPLRVRPDEIGVNLLLTCRKAMSHPRIFHNSHMSI